MSIPVPKSCIVAGTPYSSGSVQTGEIVIVNGGGRADAIYSGSLAGAGLGGCPGAVAAGADVFFWSGAGRLVSIQPHLGLLSGAAVNFYDTALAASGGPIAASGHKLIARLPATQEMMNLVTNSGQIGNVNPIIVNAPFQSGLACRASSGCPGFTIFFNVEVNSNFPNA